MPSRSRGLLESMIGRRVMRLTHYIEDTPEEQLHHYAFRSRNVTRPQLFGLAGELVVMQLDDGREICISSSAELVSITIEPAETCELPRAEWGKAIEATDPTYSEPQLAAIVGRTIARFRVLQIDVPRTDEMIVFKTKRGERRMAAKIVDRPREAALELGFADGTQLVFSSTLLDVPNDFALTTRLTDPDVPVIELLRIE